MKQSPGAPRGDIERLSAHGGRPLFGVGSVYGTPAVLHHLTANGLSAERLLHRHQVGDWGDLDADDRAANDRALKHGSRILSLYMIDGKRVYVITEAESDDGIRRATTLLFAEEY